MQRKVVIPKVGKLGWQDLFPTFSDPRHIDSKSMGVAELCWKIGLPFPVEGNPGYATWWHLLHEVGHWAVKPQWYLEYSAWMRDDIFVTQGHLFVPAGTIPGVEQDVNIPEFQLYNAGNDLIPNVALPHDGTPGEDETRVWSLDVIQHFGWPHPFDENVVDGAANVTSGDTAFHKVSSAHVWRRGLVRDPIIRAIMKRWGIAPLHGQFRAKDDGFVVPFMVPTTPEHLIANMDAMLNKYSPGQVSPQDRAEWVNDYLLPRYRKYFTS